MESNSNENKSANTSGPAEIQNWDDTPLIRDKILTWYLCQRVRTTKSDSKERDRSHDSI